MVTDYVRQLSKRSARTWSEDIWLEKIGLLAGFFDSDTVDVDEATGLQSELDILEQGDFNASVMLRNLAPTCEDLLVKCYWSGGYKKCEDIFALHATVDGHCCIFNYQTQESNSTTEYAMGTGSENGLTVLLNVTTDDYFYAGRNFIGFTVNLFAPYNFPDSSAGEVQEIFVSPGQDVDVELQTINQVSTPQVRDYSAAKRRCYFVDELRRDYGEAYSKSQCLSRCRLRTILSQCGCIPFYASKELVGLDVTPNYCTLRHTKCLNHFSVAENIYETYINGSASEDSEQEFHTSIDCEHCLPLCTFNSYSYRKVRSRILGKQSFSGFLKMLDDTGDLTTISLLKLYFSSAYSIQYHEDVIFNWYQILSNIGGVIGICMGCSIISGVEVLYFFGFRYFENLLRLRKVGMQSK